MSRLQALVALLSPSCSVEESCLEKEPSHTYLPLGRPELLLELQKSLHGGGTLSILKGQDGAQETSRNRGEAPSERWASNLPLSDYFIPVDSWLLGPVPPTPGLSAGCRVWALPPWPQPHWAPAAGPQVPGRPWWQRVWVVQWGHLAAGPLSPPVVLLATSFQRASAWGM